MYCCWRCTALDDADSVAEAAAAVLEEVVPLPPLELLDLSPLLVDDCVDVDDAAAAVESLPFLSPFLLEA